MVVRVIAIPVLIFIFLLSGCATNAYQARFTNQQFDPDSVDRDYLEENFVLTNEKAELVLNRHFFVYIPLNAYFPFSDSYVTESLLQRFDGDVVTDLSIERKFLFLLYYNRYYVVATGDVWKRKERL